MKKIESIYDSEKFGKIELRKIKGGVRDTNTNRATNTPRRMSGGESIIDSLDADEDEA